jgi:serine/threonine-protein kinase RsbW
MPDPGRPHDVSALTPRELEQARRELAASLALARPGSLIATPIRARLTAIDTELAARSEPRPQPGRSPAGLQEVTPSSATQAVSYQRTYPGYPAQVAQVRRDLTRHLAGCLAADDAVLIASETAANAVLHSASAGKSFTIRCQASPGHLRLEVEDLGGPWHQRSPGDRPHGLDILATLTGPDGWGTQPASAGRRIVWAELSW